MDDWKRGDYSEGDFNLDMSEIDKKLADDGEEQESIKDMREEREGTPSASRKREKQQKQRRSSRKTDKQVRSRSKKGPAFKMDLDSVQQGIIMKELLSPPRAKSPHPVFRRLMNRHQ